MFFFVIIKQRNLLSLILVKNVIKQEKYIVLLIFLYYTGFQTNFNKNSIEDQIIL